MYHDNAEWALRIVRHCKSDVDCAFDAICEIWRTVHASYSIINGSWCVESLVSRDMVLVQWIIDYQWIRQDERKWRFIPLWFLYSTIFHSKTRHYGSMQDPNLNIKCHNGVYLSLQIMVLEWPQSPFNECSMLFTGLALFAAMHVS